MKIQLVFLLIAILSFGCAQPRQTEQADPVEVEAASDEGVKEEDLPAEQDSTSAGAMVYVTSGGDKFHTADCRYSKDAQPMKLTQAKAEGKTACGICKPNSKTGEKQVRCTGITADGTQCKRYTSDASGMCFQHKSS